MAIEDSTLQLLILITCANAAPVAASMLFGPHFNAALDRGFRWFDRRPLLGHSKTIRGIIAAYVLTAAAALVIKASLLVAMLVATGAMLGDLLSSFCKRRLNIPSHQSAPGLDQLPESILPLVFVHPIVHLHWYSWLTIIAMFCLIESLLSYYLTKLGY